MQACLVRGNKALLKGACSFQNSLSNNTPTLMCLKSHVIYKLSCPACNAEYIGKTDRCLRVPVDEHSSDHNSAMFQHLHGCEAFKFLFSLNNLPECFSNKADELILNHTFTKIF